MALPELIEISPLPEPVRARITVPGSKSITNRALLLAALCPGCVLLEGALWSEDTQVMVECLRSLGYPIEVAPDMAESCNRILSVHGGGGRVPDGGSEQSPRELFVGNAGTAARFLAPLLCLGKGVYRLHGTHRMHERPQAALLNSLRTLGYRVESPNDKLPACIYGTGPRPGRCRVSIEESSQFASALLLCASFGGWHIEVTGENAEWSPYVAMTLKLLDSFPRNGGEFHVEPDASSGSYFWAVNNLLPGTVAPQANPPRAVTVASWPASDWQIDAAFPRFLSYHPSISRQGDLGDSILTAMVLAPFAPQKVKFTDLGRLRVQECERVFAMRTELSRCGVRVEELGDTLIVQPSAGQVHGAEIETYDDHRIAMAFAILGLKVPGIKIKNPSCVKKTFPNFFQKLAAAPPQGLGVSIRDGSGSPLPGDALFAD